MMADLSPKHQQTLLSAAERWLEELHAFIIPGASCEEERDSFDLEAYRIEDALRAVRESTEEV
jgi:hypothetical protein